MIEKIRVASLTNGMGIGGTAREIITIHKNLNKEFFSHFVISLGSKDDARAKFIGEKKIFFISDPKEIARIIKENNIDVIYTHRHGRNEPQHDAIAQELDDATALLEMNTFSVKDKGYFGHRLDKHVFVSKTNLVKYCIQNKYPFDFKKFKTVYGLIDCDNWLNAAPTDGEIQEYKKKLGLEGSFVIGRISRPVMEKWDDEILVMWKHLSKLNSKIKFLAYGVPESRKKLFLNAGSSDNLVLLDQTTSDKELGLFYATIDVLVHDSQIGECWCSTIEEAMLFKKPVVVKSTPFPKFVWGRTHTKDNGQVEQIKNGVNGYVVNNGTALARAVNELFNHPERVVEMGQKNYTDVIENYDGKIGIHTFEKIFIESLLDKNIELSSALMAYYNAHNFFPDEKSIKAWFQEYYERLDQMYGKEYGNSIIEKAWLLYLKLKRKTHTVLKKL